MRSIILLAAGFGILAITAQAATLSSGTAVVDWDAAAWDSLAGDIGLPRPVLTLNSFFDAEAVAARNYSQILRDPPTNAIYTGQSYRMNGPVVTNLDGRTSQPTTFQYTPGDPEGHSGAIGLAGISRFSVSGGGALLYGDYTLQFDEARRARGGSGWYLKGNIPPVAPAFDLVQVRLQETGNRLQLDADLAVTFELAHFLYSTPSDTLRDVGEFHFSATVVEGQPGGPVIREARMEEGALVLLGSGGTPGASYTLRSASSLDEATWSEVKTGTFDAGGASSNSVPLLLPDRARWFRLEQP